MSASLRCFLAVSECKSFSNLSSIPNIPRDRVPEFPGLWLRSCVMQ